MASSEKSGDFAAYYDKIWLNRHEYFSTHRTRFLDSWKFLLPFIRPNMRILDLGGVGPLAGYASINNGASCEVCSTDLRFPLPFGANSFDLVICTETIEHIKDNDGKSIEELERFNYSGVNSMLKEFHRVLSPKMFLLVTTPNCNSYITLFKWLNGQLPLMDPNHVREFSIADLTDKCMSAGFAVERLEALDTWSSHFGPEVAKLKKLLSNKKYNMTARGDNLLGVFSAAK